MATFLAILNGLAAIPKLIASFENMKKEWREMKQREWGKLSIEIERRLDHADTREDFAKAAKEIQSLIRNMR